KGQLLGCTEKTSDFYQADEEWWQKAFALPAGRANIEGLNFDERAQGHSIDVAIPIWRQGREGVPVGVLKGVLNATQVFASLEPVVTADQSARQIVLADGRILANLYGSAN